MQKDLLFILQGEPTFIVVSCENDMYLCRELVHRNIGESLPHFSLEGQLIVNYNISIVISILFCLQLIIMIVQEYSNWENIVLEFVGIVLFLGKGTRMRRNGVKPPVIIITIKY